MGSSPSQLPPGDVTGALREAILLPRLPGESATAPSYCLATQTNLAQASLVGTFRARREAAEMGTRDDEYDYLFKGRIQDGKFSSHVFSTCHHTCPTKLFEPQNMAIASDQVPHRTANYFFDQIIFYCDNCIAWTPPLSS